MKTNLKKDLYPNWLCLTCLAHKPASVMSITKRSDLCHKCLQSPFEFRINGQNSMDYLDLKNSQIYVRLKVRKSDGAALTTEKVGTAHLFLQSLCSSTEVTLQNKASITCNYNPYRAYIQTVLNYGQDALSTQMESQGWRMDDADSPAVTDTSKSNTGLYERSLLILRSNTIDLQGPIFHDLFSLNRYLLNQVDVNVKMYISPVNFALCAADATVDFKIDVEDIYILVKKIRVIPAVIYAHAQTLEKSNALYPFKKSRMSISKRCHRKYFLQLGEYVSRTKTGKSDYRICKEQGNERGLYH